MSKVRVPAPHPALTAAVLVALLWPALAAAAEHVLLRVEAEDYTAHGGGATQTLDRPAASGGKTVSYWEDPGVWLEYSLDVPQAGDYLLSLGYALTWPDTVRTLILDGREVGEVTLAGTGSWDSFAATTAALRLPPLSAGRHQVRLLNARSRGLSLDWLALHTPDVFVHDRQVTPAEQAALLARYHQEGATTLALGQVRAELSEDGQLRFAQVGDVVLAADTPRDAGPVPSVRLATVGRLAVAVVSREGLLDLWITDGYNLYAVRRCRVQRPLQLPLPVLAGERQRLVVGRTQEGTELNFGTPWPAREVPHLALGGLYVTAAPPLRVGPWAAEGGAPAGELPLQQYTCGWVGAVRFAPRWGADQPAIAVRAEGQAVLVRETATRYPTLAAFYGETGFDLRLDSEGCTLTEAAGGESLRL